MKMVNLHLQAVLRLQTQSRRLPRLLQSGLLRLRALNRRNQANRLRSSANTRHSILSELGHRATLVCTCSLMAFLCAGFHTLNLTCAVPLINSKKLRATRNELSKDPVMMKNAIEEITNRENPRNRVATANGLVTVLVTGLPPKEQFLRGVCITENCGKPLVSTALTSI